MSYGTGGGGNHAGHRPPPAKPGAIGTDDDGFDEVQPVSPAIFAATGGTSIGAAPTSTAALAAGRAPVDADDIDRMYEEALSFSGRCCGGLVKDCRRRGRVYKSDFVDGFTSVQSLSSIGFIFFAAFAPAVTFGGVMSEQTNDAIGAMEMLMATSICGMAFALLGGQPVVIMGGTGPLLVFTQMLYNFCESYEIEFLPFYAWVGLWIGVMTIILAVVDGSAFVKRFTRFVEETFAALISVIFIWEALEKLYIVYKDHPMTGPDELPNIALLAVILVFGTAFIALKLSGLRKTNLFPRGVRKIISKFAVVIALVVTVFIDLVIMNDVESPKLDIPEGDISPTMGNRTWFVNPFGGDEKIAGYIPFTSLIPAALGTILVFMDQQITGVIINKRDNKLRKGPGYHLDLLITGIMVIFCSLLGLPWLVAATVRSIAHLQSLATYDRRSGAISSVLENRVSPFIVHLLVGLSVVFLRPALAMIPTPVLYGLFLYMGIASLSGNQFFERVYLVFVPKAAHPRKVPYVRNVGTRKMHLFTLIQALCVGALWVVKFTPAALVFPLMILLLLPVRRQLMTRLFTARELDVLDAPEAGEEASSENSGGDGASDGGGGMSSYSDGLEDGRGNPMSRISVSDRTRYGTGGGSVAAGGGSVVAAVRKRDVDSGSDSGGDL